MTLISKEVLANDSTNNLVTSGINLFSELLKRLPSSDQQTNPPVTDPEQTNPPVTDPDQTNPTYPYDADVTYMMQQLQQYWTNFEMQLVQLPPPQQQYAISYARLAIAQQLAPFPPEQQQAALNLLQQTMSPDLAQVLLF